MATKKRPTRKGWTAANQNPGGTKSTPTKMLDVITSTSKFGVGMKNGDGDYSRPGETKGNVRHARSGTKPPVKSPRKPKTK